MNTSKQFAWALFCTILFSFSLSLSGCSYFQTDKTSSNLEKQIERQQRLQELSQEQEPQQNLTTQEYEDLGDRYILQNDINRAYLYYIKGLTQEPNKTTLLHKQAFLLLKKKKFVDAEQVYVRLLEINDKDALALEGLGQSLLNQKKIFKAEQNFLSAVELNNKLWKSHHFLALIYSSRYDYINAIEEYEQTLSIKPQDSDTLNNLAVTYYLIGEYERAVQILTALTKTSKNKKTYNNLGLAYIQLGRYDEALAAFKKGTQNEAYAYNNLGYEYLLNKRYEQAIQAFERAIALNPIYYPAANKNLEQAKQAFKRVKAH